MRCSSPVLRVGDIEIRIYLISLLLLAWSGIAYFQEGGTSAVIEGIGFIGAVSACALFYEVGPVAAGRRYGIQTLKITLSRSTASLSVSAWSLLHLEAGSDCRNRGLDNFPVSLLGGLFRDFW